MKRVVVLTALALVSCSGGAEGVGETVTIEQVVDAITFRTTTGERIRMVGVRTPGAGSPVECYGKEALEAAESLVGKEVRLEVEPLLEQAQDGAYVRYVWLVIEDVEDAPASASGLRTGKEEVEQREILVNEKALEMGTAFPLVGEEMLYAERMLSAARYASATEKGLWGACTVENVETSRGNWLTTQPIDECVIKGKVTADGEKLYRTPSCPAYAETTVILSEGGRWFCAEDTAQDAGFIRAEDC